MSALTYIGMIVDRSCSIRRSPSRPRRLGSIAIQRRSPPCVGAFSRLQKAKPFPSVRSRGTLTRNEPRAPVYSRGCGHPRRIREASASGSSQASSQDALAPGNEPAASLIADAQIQIPPRTERRGGLRSLRPATYTRGLSGTLLLWPRPNGRRAPNSSPDSGDHDSSPVTDRRSPAVLSTCRGGRRQGQPPTAPGGIQLSKSLQPVQPALHRHNGVSQKL